jgi:hypothetical protein
MNSTAAMAGTVTLARADVRTRLRRGDRVTAIDGRERDTSLILTITGGWTGKGFPYRLPNGITGTLYPDTHLADTLTVERPAPKPRRRTVDGLTVEALGPGAWKTLDGRWEITYQEQGYGECENPHPMRSGGYCEGGESHWYYGWQVWDTAAHGGSGEYAYDIRNVGTFTEATATLAAALRHDGLLAD